MAEEQTQERKLPRKLPKRVKTPTLIQMEAVECGAASLGIMQRAFGLWLPLEKLRVDCGVSRDGSKASNILKASRKHGMEAKGIRQEMEQVYQLEMPVVLFWNFNHFLVLEGFRGKKVYLNDPATGPRIITHDELDASFTGVVLILKPGAEFKSGGEKPDILGALQKRLKGHHRAMWFVMFCGLFLVVPGLVVPTFTRFFIDEILVGANNDWLRPLLLGMGICAVIQVILGYLQQYFLLRFETKLALTSSAKFFTHVLRLPIEFFAQRYAGEIGSRVQINDKVANIIADKLIQTIIDLVMLTFYAALMFLYSVPLSVMCIALAFLNIGAIKLIGRKRVDATRRLLQEEGKLMGTGMGGLQMIETLKATGGENEFFSRWSGYQAKTLKAKAALSLYAQMTQVVPTFVDALSTAAMLGFGGWLVMNGQLTIGMLVAFQVLFKSFSRPIKTFVNFGNTLQELQGDMNRLDDVLRYGQAPQYTKQYEPQRELEGVIKLSGHIEFRDVSFGYSPLEAPLIDKFNLTIQPGHRVALVGGSGSGKSTIAKLLSGLYSPFSGQILFDGVPREEIEPRLVNNSVGVIDQDVFLFDGTIKENLTMWDSTIPDPYIVQACRDAAIEEIIVARPGGYQSMVAEGGSNFSGGQRQRLEIARALVANPSMLVLDEATSALDTVSEKHIDSAVRRRGCTCLIVAHRLSTIRDADEIVVMERGKIVERGRHDDLKTSGGYYSKLIKE
ncbi:MAG: NHLP family bacteriocin export ABC transporter peptidase/permease/ATPase subunit [Verrucomicrobiales bacterium]